MNGSAHLFLFCHLVTTVFVDLSGRSHQQVTFLRDMETETSPPCCDGSVSSCNGDKAGRHENTRGRGAHSVLYNHPLLTYSTNPDSFHHDCRPAE